MTINTFIIDLREIRSILTTMVTITLDRGQGLDKTHFTDLEELMAYLNGRLSPKFPHEDPKFMQELERRSEEYKNNPSIGVPFEETLERIRNGRK